MPVRDDVRGVCELLGFDPLHLANEGKVVLVVRAAGRGSGAGAVAGAPAGTKRRASSAASRHEAPGGVRVETEVGGVRRLQRPAGELLPRIC